MPTPVSHAFRSSLPAFAMAGDGPIKAGSLHGNPVRLEPNPQLQALMLAMLFDAMTAPAQQGQALHAVTVLFVGRDNRLTGALTILWPAAPRAREEEHRAPRPRERGHAARSWQRAHEMPRFGPGHFRPADDVPRHRSEARPQPPRDWRDAGGAGAKPASQPEPTRPSSDEAPPPPPSAWQHDISPYAVLGVKEGETDSQVLKKAYRKSALAHHPDKASDHLNATEKAERTAKFQLVSEAYRHLSSEA